MDFFQNLVRGTSMPSQVREINVTNMAAVMEINKINKGEIMIEHLIYACILVLIQAWILPAAFNTKNMQWMLSNRDANPDTTLYYDRSKKAFANLQESIPVFFLLGLLGVITVQIYPT